MACRSRLGGIADLAIHNDMTPERSVATSRWSDDDTQDKAYEGHMMHVEHAQTLPPRHARIEEGG